MATVNDFPRTQQQLTTIEGVSWQTRLTLGVSPFRWYTLILLGSGIVALVVSHLVVLFNAESQVPNPTNNSTPIDTVNIVNLFFVVVLIVGTILALQNVSDFISTIARSIKIQKSDSQFFDPIKEDINALRALNKPLTNPARYSASFIVVTPDVDRQIEKAAKDTVAQQVKPGSFGALLRPQPQVGPQREPVPMPTEQKPQSVPPVTAPQGPQPNDVRPLPLPKPVSQ